MLIIFLQTIGGHYLHICRAFIDLNPALHYQGPGVLCTPMIGISAVVYFFALTDKFACKCKI